MSNRAEPAVTEETCARVVTHLFCVLGFTDMIHVRPPHLADLANLSPDEARAALNRLAQMRIIERGPYYRYRLNPAYRNSNGGFDYDRWVQDRRPTLQARMRAARMTVVGGRDCPM